MTGIGVVSALGVGREQTWQNLIDGRCGIGDVTLFDTTGYRSRLAAEIDCFDSARYFTPLEQRRWSRSDQIAVIAAGEALEDAGLSNGSLNPERTGVVFGAGTSDLLRNEDYYAEMRAKGVARAAPSRIVNFFSNTPVDVVGTLSASPGPATASSRPVRRARSRSVMRRDASARARWTRCSRADRTHCAG